MPSKVPGFNSSLRGTTTRLPLFERSIWLPRCRTGLNPAFRSIFRTSRPDRIGSLDCDSYYFQFVWFLRISAGFKFLENQLDSFLDVPNCFFFRFTLAYGCWQFYALNRIASALFPLQSRREGHSLGHVRPVDQMSWRALGLLSVIASSIAHHVANAQQAHRSNFRNSSLVSLA